MAKKAFFKGEKFIFSRVKGNAETDYREGDINITPTNIGLGSVNNTSDKDKPVSTAQQKAIDAAYANSNAYTDQKIANLINGAPEIMDTFKEVSDAISASKTTEEALNKAIGTKANQAEVDTHTSNDTIHITASEREKWNKNGGVTGVRGSEETEYKVGQVTLSKDDIGLGNVDNTSDSTKTVACANNLTIHNNLGSSSTRSLIFQPQSTTLDASYDIVGYDATNHIMTYGNTMDRINTRHAITTFTSNDSATGDSTPPTLLTDGETHASIFSKVSTIFKNVRWLLSKMGTTDISALGDGTVTGALSTLNSNKANWELLWYNQIGVAQGSVITFDRKNYTVFAMNVSGTIIFCCTATEQKGVVCGTPVLLWTGNVFDIAIRTIMFDAYSDHFYVSICSDYMCRSSADYSSGRVIQAIYGVK